MNDELYRHAEQVVYGYKNAGPLERLVCEFWYIICRRWNWIFHKGDLL